MTSKSTTTPSPSVFIQWTPEKLVELKAAHANALSLGKEDFVYGGNLYWRDYAKYLIEYLEGVLK